MQEMEYKQLTLPKLNWEKAKSTDMFGELVVGPLEPGFGITLGNALRRVMLSSVEGCAVTSVVIKGVNNEFSSLEGVIEDTLHILLNIKGIVIKNKTGQPGNMTLSFKGEGVVRASDIKADDHLEIVNKDYILAHVANDGDLDIQFFVEMGRGYRAAQWPAGESLTKDGMIHLDAAFSPVTRIEYKVEKMRVGQAIDYDKLILSVNTNGAVAPKDIVYYATSVLRTQLEHFLSAPEIPFNEISKLEVDTEEN